MNRNAYRGFTLIEVMIVVVIVSILVAIALPSYQDSVRKSNRADCKDKLFSVAQAQERHFSQYASYATGVTGAAGANNLGFTSADSDGGACTVSVVVGGVGNTTYDLTGTPLKGDPDCGNLTLDNLGRKTPAPVPGSVKCW